MTDLANKLRRYSRKIAHPAGDVPSVMLAAADEIERLAKMEAALEEVLNSGLLLGQYTIHAKMTDLVCAALKESK